MLVSLSFSRLGVRPSPCAYAPRRQAFACRRADKGKMEASSYFCMGVLHDNLEEWDVAIKCFQNFLAVCRRIGDRVGEALAYNSIGVDFQLRGGSGAAKEKNLKMAVHYHTKHLSVADGQGQFVAHTNLGLSYASLGKVSVVPLGALA